METIALDVAYYSSHSVISVSLNWNVALVVDGNSGSYQLATLTFKALHTCRPPYLSDLLQHHEPTRSLRSSSFHQLLIPRPI